MLKGMMPSFAGAALISPAAKLKMKQKALDMKKQLEKTAQFQTIKNKFISQRKKAEDLKNAGVTTMKGAKEGGVAKAGGMKEGLMGGVKTGAGKLKGMLGGLGGKIPGIGFAEVGREVLEREGLLEDESVGSRDLRPPARGRRGILGAHPADVDDPNYGALIKSLVPPTPAVAKYLTSLPEEGIFTIDVASSSSHDPAKTAFAFPGPLGGIVGQLGGGLGGAKSALTGKLGQAKGDAQNKLTAKTTNARNKAQAAAKKEAAKFAALSSAQKKAHLREKAKNAKATVARELANARDRARPIFGANSDRVPLSEGVFNLISALRRGSHADPEFSRFSMPPPHARIDACVTDLLAQAEEAVAKIKNSQLLWAPDLATPKSCALDENGLGRAYWSKGEKMAFWDRYGDYMKWYHSMTEY